MNSIYRIVWNPVLKVWQVASEITRSRRKAGGGGRLLLRRAVKSIAVPLFTSLSSLGLAAPVSNVLPTGAAVVAGQAAINQSGNAMNINQSTQRAAIDWQTFNIGTDAEVNFNQPNAASVTLNRVLTGDGSQILGNLNANGQVFISNPNGVYFSSSSNVNVGGLVATTHSISVQDFMAGGSRFERDGATGSVVNEGAINASLGGYVAMLAPEVRNNGVVMANMGTVAMAAGEAITLDFNNSGSLTGITASQSEIESLVENNQAVIAPGGLIIMSAVAADQLQGAVINNNGELSANSITQQGGRIFLTGDDITMSADSIIDAGGAAGGGEVLVGGQWQGSGDMHQATTVTMASGASISASASENGDGGTVVLWSDVNSENSNTRVHGSITARGGQTGGDGGRVETSGHFVDIENITVDAGASAGQGGEWLIDPYDYTIDAVAAIAIVGTLDTGTDVTVTTTADVIGYGSSGNASDNGDITVSSSIITGAMSGDATLTLQAARHITLEDGAVIDASQNGNSASLNVRFWADSDNSGDGINQISGASINTNGGWLQFGNNESVTINSQTFLVGGDVYFNGSVAQTMVTDGGAIDIYGETIIGNTNGVSFSSAGGNIGFHGVLNSGNAYTYVDQTGDTAHDWNWARTDAINGTGGAGAIGDSYLVTITSRLENAIAGLTAGYNGAWIGAWRESPASSYDWTWVDGPEAGQQFFTQAGVGGTATPGSYANFGAGEPNGSLSASGESVGQFFGSAGQWNDLPITTNFSPSQDNIWAVLGYVRETNLAVSPLTVNAGSGTVTFDSAVGGSKALASLSITAGATNINGGVITTEGVQTFNAPVVLGADTTFTTTNSDIIFNSSVDADGLGTAWSSTFDILADSTYYWVDWTSSDANNVYGSINIAGDVINVAYHNDQGFFGAQTSGGTNYWTGSPSPFTSANIANGPSTTDIIQLQYQGSQTLTFSESVENLAFALVSLNGNGYGFDQDFAIESYTGLNGAGDGYYGTGTLSQSIVDGQFQLLGTSGEPHGTVRFNNAFSILSWESLSDETWNGFTVGVSGSSASAGTVQFNGAIGGGDGLGALNVNAALATTDDIIGAASLAVTGNTNLGGNVTTVGDQTFNSALSLTSDAILATTNDGSVQAVSTIDGAFNLSINTNGTGNTTLTGNVGGNTPLTGFTINSNELTAGAIALAANQTIDITNSGASTITGVISGSGVALNKNGTGNLTLTGANTYTGDTTINNGILMLGAADVIPDASALIVNANGTFSLNSFDETVASIAGSGLIENGSIVREGIVLWLDAGNGASYDGTGTTWYDLSGNGYDGTLYGSPTYNGTDRQFEFTDNSQYAQLGALPADFLSSGDGTVDGVTVFTVADFGTANFWERIVDFGNGNPSDNIILSRHGSTEAVNFEIYAQVTPNKLDENGTHLTIPTAGGVRSYTGLADGDNLQLYVDGVAELTAANSVLPSEVIRTNNYIGRSNWAADDTLRGAIGIVLVYDRALSSAEIQQNHAALIARTAATLTVGGNNQDTTFSGTIENGADTLNLVKNGSGALTLTGDNGYSGTTTINAGAIYVGDGGSSGNLGLGNIINNSELFFDRSDDFTVVGDISGTGDIDKLGNNELTLTGLTTYTGSTTITDGKLILENDAPTTATSGFNGTGALAIQPAGSSFSSTFATTGWNFGSDLTGLEIGSSGNTADINLNSAISFGGPFTVYGGTLTLSSNVNTTGDINLNATGLVQNAGVAVSTVGGDITFNISNASWTAGNDYAVTIGSGGATATVNAGGGDIVFNSDFDLVGVSGGTDRAMLLNGAAISTTGTGSISITGDATNNGNTGNTWGVALTDTTLLSDSGAITVNGTGGFSSSNSRGVAVDGQRLDVLSNTGAITLTDTQPSGLTGTYTGLYMRPNSVANSHFGADGSTVVTSSSDITFRADRLAFDVNNGFGSEISTTGNVALEPFGSSFAAATTIDNVTFATSPTSLIIGRSTNTADLTLDSAISLAGPISVYGGAIALNAQLQAIDNTITLQGSGSVTDGASGYVSADNLLLLDGTINLDSASNAVDVVAASGIDSLDYTNSNALSIGSVNGTDGISATGEVSIATLTGDLSLEQNLITASTSGSAVILNADENAAAGTASGGNLMINNNSTITVGVGGTATLFGGSVNASAGLTNLVGSGTGRFRYNSDESTTNYSLALAGGVNAVYREQPTISGLVDQTLTYGDSASPSLTGVNGDTQAQIYAGTPSLLFSGGTSGSGNYIVGSHSVTITGATEQLGYAAPSATFTVNPLSLTYSGSVLDHVYDGTTAASVSHGAAGVLTGDDVNVSTTASAFSDANVADDIAVNISGITLFGGDANNYSIATTAATTGNITPAMVSLSASRTYDGTTDLSGAVSIITGVGSETLTYTVASASDAHVATPNNYISAITLTDAVDGSGGLASNYSLPTLNATNAPVTILARPITASAEITGTLSRVYDGTTDANGASVSGSVSGALVGDSISYDGSGFSLAYDSAHVLSASQITASGSGGFSIDSSLYGSLATDYSFTDAAITPVSASITPRPLTASANLVGSFSRAYDGTTNADGVTINATVNGAITGDDLVFDASGYSVAYDSAHVAYASQMGASQIDASGAGDFIINTSAAGSLASDYSFTDPVIAPVSASITPVTLTASLTNTDVSRSYNGSVDAPGDFVPQWSVTGLINGDSQAVFSTSGFSYNSADVLTANSLTADSLSIDSIAGSNGSLASDYELANSNPAINASISPALVSVTGLAAGDKTYDGTNLVSIIDWGAVSTGVGSETLNLSASSASFEQANAGTDLTVTALGYALADGDNGGLADNYQLTNTSATTTATINPAALTISANNDARFVTQNDAVGYAGVSFTGFIDGETAVNLTGTLNIQRSNSSVGSAGDYEDVLIAGGYSSNNYDIQYLAGDYSIVGSDQLLVRVDDASSSYGASAQYSIASVEYFDGSNVVRLDDGSVSNASVSLDENNLVTVNDGAAGSASFTLAPTDARFSGANLLNVGAYQLGVSGAVTGNNNNFNNTISVIGSHEVSARAISASADAGVSRVYDGTSAMNNISIELAGVANGDDVLASGFGNFETSNVGNSLAYTVFGLTLTGADSSNYQLAAGDSFSGSNGQITPAEVVIGGLTAENRVYNGNSIATIDTRGIVFNGVIDGDDLVLAASEGIFETRHVGQDIHVALTNTYTGSDLGNYTLVDQTSSRANISRLDSVRWVGGANGNWFDPANWAGGAIPDLSNVANVIIPEGVTVSFDTLGAVAPADTAPVNIESLGAGGGLAQSNGELNVGAGGVVLNSVSQSGGGFNNAGNFSANSFIQTAGFSNTEGDFTVTGNFSQTGTGTIAVGGNANITDADNGLLLGNITVVGDTVISSTDGPINQTSGTALSLLGRSLFEASVNGLPADIVLDAPLNNFVGPVSASGNHITLVDGNGGLVLGNINAAGEFVANSSDGDISQAQDSAIVVQDASIFNASTNGEPANILLANLANDFIGSFNATGANVLVTDGRGSLTLGTLIVSGDLLATSIEGDILQSTGSQISVLGDAVFNAEQGVVTLNDDGNNFAGAIDKNDTIPKGGAALVIPPAAEQPATPGSVHAPAPLLENGTSLIAAGPEGVVEPFEIDSIGNTVRQVSSTAALSSNTAGTSTVLSPASEANNSHGADFTRVENTNINARVSVAVTTAPTPNQVGRVDVIVPSTSTSTGFIFDLPDEVTNLASAERALSVSLEDGSPLPNWLQFDAITNRFSAANVPANGLPIRIKVTGPQGDSLMVISRMDNA